MGEVLPMLREYHFNISGVLKAATLDAAVEQKFGSSAVLGIARRNRNGGGLFQVFMWASADETIVLDEVYVSTGEYAGFPSQTVYPLPGIPNYEQERVQGLLDYIDNPFTPEEVLEQIRVDEEDVPVIVEAIADLHNPFL
jgi:hypothetical protein